MANLIARKLNISESWAPLSADRLVGRLTISAPAGNAGSVLIKGDTGQEVPMAPGEWHTLEGVDLAEVEVKGTVGDVLTIIGGTR